VKKSLRALTPTDDAIKTLTPSQALYVPSSALNSPDYKAPFADIGKDVFWFISGSKQVKNIADGRHIAVFGGDVVISGSLRVEGCELTGSFNFECDTLELTGSIEVEGVGKFTNSIATTNINTLTGDPFLIAGNGVSFSSAASGQITITATTSVSNLEWNEKLTGTANGINEIFTLIYAPSTPTSIMVFMNGVLQEAGVTADFTISGSTITFNNPPPVESKITATYSR